jgi:formylglycine-generating enzyme required for sulfatase activity
VIPTEDEWYKAAYHKNDGVTDHYWDYPIGSDTRPSNVLLVPDPGNSANFYDSLATPPYTIGFDLYRTPVGQFVRSQSPYGTFDQGGNIKEWDETAVYAGLSRGVRGGDWDSSSLRLAARYRGDGNPTVEGYNLGFRIAGVPEPGSVAMLISAGVAALLWCNRRK